MKKLLLLLFITTCFLPKKSYSQNDNSQTVVTAVTAIATGLSIWAAIEEHKEYYESIATDFIITNYPEYKQFRLKMFQLKGKKGSDNGGMNVVPFSFVELEYGVPTDNRKILLLFSSSNKINDFGVDYKNFSFKMIETDEWNEIIVTYAEMCSMPLEKIEENLVPVYKSKYTSDERWIGVRDKKNSFARISNVYLSASGLKSNGKLIYPFMTLTGDDYIVSDFSDEFRIIANERSMGLYIIQSQESILIKRRLINNIHSFLNNLYDECE